jgi:hypothetical protein
MRMKKRVTNSLLLQININNNNKHNKELEPKVDHRMVDPQAKMSKENR